MRGKVGTAVRFERFLLLTGSGGRILGRLRFGRFRQSRQFGFVWFVCYRRCACVFYKGMLQLDLDVDVDFQLEFDVDTDFATRT